MNDGRTLYTRDTLLSYLSDPGGIGLLAAGFGMADPSFAPSLCITENPLAEARFFPSGESLAVAKHPRYAAKHYHTHEFIETIYMYSGRCKNVVEGVPLIMEEGELFMVSPLVYHYLNVFEGGVAVNLLIRRGALTQLFGSVSDSRFADYVGALTKSLRYPKYYRFRETRGAYPEFSEQMDGLLLELINREPYYLSAAEGLLGLVVSRLLRAGVCGECSPALVSEAQPAKKLLGYMYDNFRTATLDGMADALGFSKTYVCRILKKHTGQTFSELLAQIRLDAACRLLVSTDIKVRDIAAETGYESSERFHRMFRAQTGTTPLKFRSEKKRGELP